MLFIWKQYVPSTVVLVWMILSVPTNAFLKSFNDQNIMGYRSITKVRVFKSREQIQICMAVTSEEEVLTGGEKERKLTLYEELGASKNDSEAELRKKYRQLARVLHPDANFGKEEAEVKNNVERFVRVVAAWNQLSDPKERLKYDRSLKAKELEESWGSLLDAGIKAAIPFAQNTFKKTVAAVETSSNAMQDVSQKVSSATQDVSQKVNLATRRFEADNKIKELVQRSERAKAKAEEMRDQLKQTKGLDTLNTAKSKLTASDARLILESFIATSKQISSEVDLQSSSSSPVPTTQEKSHSKKSEIVITKEIEALATAETEYQMQQKAAKERDMEITTANDRIEIALNAEAMAVKRLEEAQQEVMEARTDTKNAKKMKNDAITQQRRSVIDLDRASSTLEGRMEKVRFQLRQKENDSRKEESTFLRQESARLFLKAKSLQSQADKLQKQSDENTLKP